MAREELCRSPRFADFATQDNHANPAVHERTTGKRKDTDVESRYVCRRPGTRGTVSGVGAV